MENKRGKIVFVFAVVVLFISIGFAYLTANLDIRGLAVLKKSVWDVHFENIVDDSDGVELTVPAKITNDAHTVDFEVSLDSPGDVYYFYVDVVNQGTMDVMLEEWSIEGLEEVKDYIDASVTYGDGISLNKNASSNKLDLLKVNGTDTLKVEVKYKDFDDTSNLPTSDKNFTLSLTTTYSQADDRAVVRDHNDDLEGPSTRFTKDNRVVGNNRWYKSLVLKMKLIDISGIDSVMYCVTTNDSCTPNETAELINNYFDIQLEDSNKEQIVCVKGTDKKNNEKVTCTEDGYLVDGTDPKISSLKVIPEDLAMRVEVQASDEHSGISKYYFSKDGGVNYVSSTEPNYTFTSLSSDDYIVMSYVEDKAGNVSDRKESPATVREYSWCQKNGITTLSDCAIIQSTNKTNISDAKTLIELKGSPDFTKTSPSFVYFSKKSSTLSSQAARSNSIVIANNYSYDEYSGKYTLSQRNLVSLDTFNKENNKHYYTCNTTYELTCQELYEIDSVSASYNDNGTTDYTLNLYTFTNDIKSYDLSNVGMFAEEDDTGTSYYYRGSVGGNFVVFADMYWRIVRINGDGSVRLMYYGTNPNKGSNASYGVVYNHKYWDPTYEGFMYNDRDFSTEEVQSPLTTYSNFNENDTFYFGKEYEYDKATNLFHLKNNDENTNIIAGVWKNDYQEILDGKYLYTCLSTKIDGTCNILFKVNSYSSATAIPSYYISYSSTSYDNATMNVSPSNIMTKLNEWYEANIKPNSDKTGNKYSDYIVDQVFCDDRSIADISNNGDGYSNYKTTFYGAFDRVYYKKRPILTCPRDTDKFTISDALGNSALKNYNPVGLLSADEVYFAGGCAETSNSLFYMNYNDGSSFWTLSPANYGGSSTLAIHFNVSSSGSIGRPGIYGGSGLRPVINLSKDVLVSGGDGTADNPYTVSLNN